MMVAFGISSPTYIGQAHVELSATNLIQIRYKMYKVIVIFSLIVILFSCKNEMKKQIVSKEKSFESVEQLQWLLGSWSNINDESQSYESWTKLNDSTLTAFSYVMVENDTVFVEVVSLQERLNDVFFTVKVPDQNDAQAITFKLIPSEKGIFTFENKAHDFPQQISYSNPVNDSIHAWIEGMVEGKPKRVDFDYKRVE
jgi:hypothetical protein